MDIWKLSESFSTVVRWSMLLPKKETRHYISLLLVSSNIAIFIFDSFFFKVRESKYYLTSCHARRELFVSKLQYFLSFKCIKYNPKGKTNNKFQVQKESDELLYVYGLVTRYGPRTSYQRKRLNTGLSYFCSIA